MRSKETSVDKLIEGNNRNAELHRMAYAKELAMMYAKWRCGLPYDFISRIRNKEPHLPIEEQLFNQFLKETNKSE